MTATALFPLGQIVATPGVLDAMAAAKENPSDYLYRHQIGDWGELDECDRRANDAALADGARVLSVYRLADDTRIWIITEADRSSTCILLPSEY